MVKHLHSIHLANGRVDTRESSTRQYAAVIVATATDVTERRYAEWRAAKRVELQDAEAARDAKLAELGMSLEQAEVRYTELKAAWDSKQFFAIVRRHEAQLKAKNPRGDRYEAFQKACGIARAEMAAAGSIDPEAEAGVYGAVKAASDAKAAKECLDKPHRYPAGTQFAVSWHLTVANARTALSAKENGWLARDAFKLEVRTDFEIRSHEVKPRVKKEVAS